MGNCKSTSHSKIESSTSAIKAQKTIEKKHKKSMRSFLRTVLLAKKRSDSKISPATSNSGTIGNDSPTVS